MSPFASPRLSAKKNILFAWHEVRPRVRKRNLARWSDNLQRASHRLSDTQSEARLRCYEHAVGRKKFTGFGSMNQATTILTHAGFRMIHSCFQATQAKARIRSLSALRAWSSLAAFVFPERSSLFFFPRKYAIRSALAPEGCGKPSRMRFLSIKP